MLATSKNILYSGYNHLLTLGADDPTLYFSPERQPLPCVWFHQFYLLSVLLLHFGLESAFHMETRSTQRAQTSLAEADHYSHILPIVKMLSLGCEKLPTPLKKKKVLDHYLHHDLGMLPLLRCFFAHLLILQYPDHHQNLISSSLYYSGPVHKISSQSVHNFLSNVVHRQTNKQTNKQTDRQTNQRYQKHNLLCQGGNYLDTVGQYAHWLLITQPSMRGTYRLCFRITG